MTTKRNIVILGGGTAGWMTAAAMAKFIPARHYNITLIASAEIGTVGVGEATIPHIRQFNELLGIDENTFIKEVGATYKLAIRFKGWGKSDSDYCHGFGYSGEVINDVEFHHYYLRAGGAAKLGHYDNYNIAALAARAHRFNYPQDNTGDARSHFGYAFHIDASLYAAYLKRYSLARGVSFIDARVTDVVQHPSGDIASLLLDNGQSLHGDLFIDCSGFRGRLIEQTLASGYENWQHWLPCDSAQAAASDAIDNPPSYTLSAAHQAGWRWQIPLQHRTGNGIVYASQWLSDEQASEQLLGAIGDSADMPRQLRFVTGKRKKSWLHNCVAIGLSSGFLEPLESTSLYLVQAAIEKLIEYFPATEQCQGAREAFNHYIDTEYERVRDFLIFHYYQNQRPEPFWQAMSAIELPDSLQARLAQFRESGHFNAYRQGLFMPVSWTTLALGQGLQPQAVSPRISHIESGAIAQRLNRDASQLDDWVASMPTHQHAIDVTKNGAAHYPAASRSLYGANNK
ncbi:tryptophan halogenase family protein [Alteromonas gilva]|uniref:Tryptophan 7-halogenase n=1 Tax=Alteromonas gilva TaxID=2987522 RepID=A0ABT5KYF8_9ALTE|nr:tryptophan halogenase family protein [Alteromonas gilva]MDC8829800.1 tryptophan 7-halogenase [Alteromonas gilva]